MKKRFLLSTLYVLLFFPFSSFGDGEILLGKDLDPYNGLDFLVDREWIHLLFYDHQKSLTLASINKKTNGIKKEILCVIPPPMEATIVYLINEKLVGYYGRKQLCLAKKKDKKWKSSFLVHLESFHPNIWCNPGELRSSSGYILPFLERNMSGELSSKLKPINNETGENGDIPIPSNVFLAMWVNDGFWLLARSQSETEEFEIKNDYRFYLGQNGKVKESQFPLLTTNQTLRDAVFISDDPPTFSCISAHWLEMWQLNEDNTEWQKTRITPRLNHNASLYGSNNSASDGGVWAAFPVDNRWTLFRLDKGDCSVKTFKTPFTADTTYGLQVVDVKSGKVDLIFFQPSFSSQTVEEVLNSPETRETGKSKFDLFFQRMVLSKPPQNPGK